MGNYLKEELYALIKSDNTIFNFLQDATLDGLWYWDLENYEDEWMNEKFWKVLGYDPKKMPHKANAWMDIINQEDLALAKTNVVAHMNDKNHPYDQVVRYKHAEGHTVWIRCRGLAIRDKDGVPKRMLGAHIEITDFKVQQELLERCNTEAKIGHWEVDLKNSKPKWSEVTRIIHGAPEGYDPEFEKAVGFYVESDRPELLRMFNESIETHKPYSGEFRIKKMTGEIIWVKVIGIPEYTDGICTRIYGTFQDIDDRKKAEIRADELIKFTQHQNERLRNFAHIVTHNLRSHVSGFKGVLSLMEENMPAKERQALMGLMDEGVVNFQQTLDDLKEVVQINLNSELPKEVLNINKVIEQTFTSLSVLAQEENVKLINEADQNVALNVVPAYFKSIVLNFTTNAIKYKSDKRDAYFKITTSEINGLCKIVFEDNGIGIDLDRHREKLFGIYKTFHRHKDSRGVGLFITKNQIETMGGNIEVESTVDVGTKFIVEFKL